MRRGKGLWAPLVCGKEAEVTSLPSTASPRGEVGREVLNFSPEEVSSDRCLGMVQSCITTVGIQWTLGSISNQEHGQVLEQASRGSQCPSLTGF